MISLITRKLFLIKSNKASACEKVLLFSTQSININSITKQTIIPKCDFENSLIVTKSCVKVVADQRFLYFISWLFCLILICLCQKITDLRNKFNNDKLMLRIAVEGGGCSGYQYTYNMEEPMVANVISRDSHTATSTGGSDENMEMDLTFGRGDPVKPYVVVDAVSFKLIQGATIDYVQEMIKNAL